MAKLTETCDICRTQLAGTVYDARTIRGPWAYMCPTCWGKHTNKVLGTGLGQKYTRPDTTHEWTKVNG